MAPNAIPVGWTFLNPQQLVSLQGKDFLEDLAKKAANRNPDAFDMYIYNDFYPYAILDLVDKSLALAHTKITQKAYQDAYYILEGLTLFNDFDMSWPMCDDGDRTQITDKAYGTLIVAMLCGLETEGKLNTTQFPGLESFLKVTAEWADAMKGQGCDALYGAYCKSHGKKLSQIKTAADVAREKAWLDEWMAGLDAENQAEAEELLKEAEEEKASASEGKLWYSGAKEVGDKNFTLSRIWKEYKEYLASVPKEPLRGPKSWDISKWTAEQKKEFEFEGASGEEEDDDDDDDLN